MKSVMISLPQIDFSKISLRFTVLLHMAQKHTLGVLFCLYGGNVTPTNYEGVSANMNTT